MLKKYRWWKDWDYRLLTEIDMKDAKIAELEKTKEEIQERFDNWFNTVHQLRKPTISREEEGNIFDKVEGGGEEEAIE